MVDYLPVPAPLPGGSVRISSDVDHPGRAPAWRVGLLGARFDPTTLRSSSSLSSSVHGGKGWDGSGAAGPAVIASNATGAVFYNISALSFLQLQVGGRVWNWYDNGIDHNCTGKTERGVCVC